MNNMKKTKKLEKFHIFAYALVIFLLGAIILGVLQFYEYKITSFEYAAISYSDDYIDNCQGELPSIYLHFWQPILYNIGVILIVLSVGTMFLELFGYVTFFQKRIAEVFTDKQMVNIISEDYKNQLKYSLLESIYKPDTVDSKEILNLFDKKLINIMDTYYYSKFDIFAECTLLDNKYILKEITRTVEIKEINSAKHNSFSTLLRLSYKELDKDCNYEPVEMISVTIDGKEYIRDSDYFETVSDIQKPYSKRITFSAKKSIDIENSTEIKLKYKTIVPLKDRNYSTAIDRLCKNMRVRVSFDSNDFEVFIKGFKFSTDTSTDFICEHYNSLSEANSNGWLLPGEGVTFSFFSKKD